MEEDPRISEWETAGLMNRECVMERLHEVIQQSYHQGRTAVQEKFNFLAIETEGKKFWNEQVFTKFLAKNSKLSAQPLLAEAGPILYHLVQYLGSFPFRSKPLETMSPLTTCEQLLRASFWVLPRHAEKSLGAGTMGNDVYMRSRSTADQRRLLFESLSDSKVELEFNEVEEKEIAAKEALEVDPHLVEMTQTNYDDDDEMYHDVLDVLSYTQDFIQPPDAPCRRRALRPLAHRLHTPIRLRQLAISRNRFKSLVKFLIFEHLGDGNFPHTIQSLELEVVANSLVNAFCHDSNKDEMVTWRSFDLALKQKSPFLFSSLYRLFSSLLKSPEEENGEYQVLSLPPLSPNHLLTPLVISQLSFVLETTASFENAPLLYQFDAHKGTPSENAAFEITSALKSCSGPFDFRILLISTKLPSTGEAYVFGAFAMGLNQSLEIIPRDDDAWERSFLFQIVPTHDVFRSKIGKKAWNLGEELWFGEKGKGISMGLVDSVKRLKIAHNIESEGVYQTTSWRGDWTLELEIDKIEVWGE